MSRIETYYKTGPRTLKDNLIMLIEEVCREDPGLLRETTEGCELQISPSFKVRIESYKVHLRKRKVENKYRILLMGKDDQDLAWSKIKSVRLSDGGLLLRMRQSISESEKEAERVFASKAYEAVDEALDRYCLTVGGEEY